MSIAVEANFTSACKPGFFVPTVSVRVASVTPIRALVDVVAAERAVPRETLPTFAQVAFVASCVPRTF